MVSEHILDSASTLEAPGARRKARILIVDDSKLQRKILTTSLKRLGYEVFEAEGGQAALDLCRRVPPDLVLSDWMMPGMDGLEFCKRFRAMPRDSYGYFILLTSKNEKEAVAQGLDNGADDFLSKPVNADELRARITAGERILDMQRQLSEQNRQISESLAEIQRLYDAVDNDLVEAKKLQQSLVRDRFRDFGPAQLSLLLRPSGHVGGDLVGFFPVGKSRCGLFAIDVSGHGISSALMTARLASYLSSSSPEQNIALQESTGGTYGILPPNEVISRLNHLVLAEMDTEHYFTMLFADVDLSTGHVVMSQAGHPHPVVHRGNGALEMIGSGGLPVGLIEGAQYELFETDLRAGDRLLLCSDGITECPDMDNGMVDEEGLLALTTELADLSGPEFLEALVWKLSEIAGQDDFPDDISAALLEFK